MKLLIIETWASDGKDQEHEDQTQIRCRELRVACSIVEGLVWVVVSAIHILYAAPLLIPYDPLDVQAEDDQAEEGQRQVVDSEAARGLAVVAIVGMGGGCMPLRTKSIKNSECE